MRSDLHRGVSDTPTPDTREYSEVLCACNSNLFNEFSVIEILGFYGRMSGR